MSKCMRILDFFTFDFLTVYYLLFDLVSTCHYLFVTILFAFACFMVFNAFIYSRCGVAVRNKEILFLQGLQLFAHC